MCIGGPALIYYVMPSEEELFLVRIHLPIHLTCPSTHHRH